MHTKRFAALALGLTLIGGTLSACTTDPPAGSIKTATYTLGPFTMTAAGTDGYRASGFRAMDHPEGDIAVKAVRWRVLDGDGEEIPATDHRLHFHHVVAYSDREPDPACGGRSERWAAPGSERTDLELPTGFAYFTSTDDDWYGNYDLMNLSDATLTGVRVEYRVEYTTDRSSLHNVTPYWLDLGGCFGEGTITVPGGGGAKSVYTKSASFKLRNPGVVVAVRGHMHDRGIDIALTDEAGREICRTAARYDDGSDGTPPPGTGDDGGMDHGDGGMDHGGGGGMDHGGHSDSGPRIVAIPLCKNRQHPVRAGEEVRVTVRYHNEEALPDAMAKMLVYVAEVPLPAPPTTRRATTTRRPATSAPTSSGPTTTTAAASGPPLEVMTTD
jgi:hypothetical protein